MSQINVFFSFSHILLWQNFDGKLIGNNLIHFLVATILQEVIEYKYLIAKVKIKLFKYYLSLIFDKNNFKIKFTYFLIKF